MVLGDTIRPYRVLGKLGEGGMGEVYRAHDSSLDRDVAIKVLPEAFADDPERLTRFEREARLLAALNHPNEQGIIHRDLKPANVKVKADGTVKVLDFGLAKALEPELSDLDAANSPTMTHLRQPSSSGYGGQAAAATKMGVILGTAAYMAPEQAVGKRVNRRADLWAFGVVLYEMLTRRPLFTGETVSHVLASVLKTDPDWTALPAGIPAGVRRLLRRCLERDVRRRLQHAGDARVEIAEIEQIGEAEAGSAPAGQLLHRRTPAVALFVTALLWYQELLERVPVP